MSKFEHSFFDLIACRSNLYQFRNKIRYKFGELVITNEGIFESLSDNNIFSPLNSNYWRKIL